jgi:hypothetical protein
MRGQRAMVKNALVETREMHVGYAIMLMSPCISLINIKCMIYAFSLEDQRQS